MTVIDGQTSSGIRVSPKKSLLRNGVLSFLLIAVPLFGSLYLLGVPNGTGAVVLAAKSVAIAVSLYAYLRYRMTYVGIDGEELVWRGFWGRSRSAPLSRVETVVLAETFRTHATDSAPQLLLRDADGRRILRMRGTFWSEKSMRTITGAIDRPLTHLPDPVTRKAFFASYPGSAYWHENRPALATLTIVAVFAVALVGVLGLMSLAGIPITAAF